MFVLLGNAYLLLFAPLRKSTRKAETLRHMGYLSYCVHTILKACLYLLCDVLHTVAKLQASLQAKKLDLASVPVLVDGTLSRLKELKENPPSST